MKRLIYTDDRGYVRVTLVRDSDDEQHPEYGVPIDTPPIEQIVRDMAKDIQNELLLSGIVTYHDVVKSQNGVSSVVKRLVSKIVEAYKLKELEENGKQ